MPRLAWDHAWRYVFRRGNQVLAVVFSVFVAISVAVFGDVFLKWALVVSALSVFLCLAFLAFAFMIRKRALAQTTFWIDEPFLPAIVDVGLRVLSAFPGAIAGTAEYRDDVATVQVEGGRKSLGEILRIEAVSDSGDTTRVTLASEPLYTQWIDWGVNRHNVEVLAELLRAELLDSGIAPLQSRPNESP